MCFRILLAGVFIVAVLGATVGCVSTSYKPYEAKETVFEGQGGTKETVDGIDFWADGSPPRKYKIIGVIDSQRQDKRISGIIQQHAIAKTAKEAGGDAVVLFDKQLEVSGYHTHGSVTVDGQSNMAYASSRTTPCKRRTKSAAGGGLKVKHPLMRLSSY